MTVSIIGFGEVGSIVASLLIGSKQAGLINLIDIDSEGISGRILDTQHAAAANDIDVTVNDRQLFEASDIIVFTAGACNAVGVSRNAIARENAEVVQAVFSGVEPEKNCMIIVVTNPVEIITHTIAEHYSENPYVKVVGTGTLLDTNRLRYLLARELTISSGEIDAMVVGEHGSHMVPLFSTAQVSTNLITTQISPDRLEEIKQELVLSARAIRKTEPATKYGVSQCVLQIMEALESETEVILPISITAPKELGGQRNCISWPMIISKNRFEYAELSCSDQEWSQVQEAYQAICSVEY